MIVQFVVQGAQSLLNNSSYNIIKLKSANHRQLSMRNDKAPFTDARVRQAIALSLDRPGWSRRCSTGSATSATTARSRPSSPRLTRASRSARRTSPRPSSCCRRPATRSGFSTTLTTEQYQEIPAAGAGHPPSRRRKIGVNINLKVETQIQLLRQGDVRQLRLAGRIMSLVDYGDRGVPERVPRGAADLARARGTRPTSRTRTYDSLVKQYVATVDLQTQKTLAGKIQTLLLNETPIVIPYFIDGLTATTSTSTASTPPRSPRSSSRTHTSRRTSAPFHPRAHDHVHPQAHRPRR